MVYILSDRKNRKYILPDYSVSRDARNSVSFFGEALYIKDMLCINPIYEGTGKRLEAQETLAMPPDLTINAQRKFQVRG